MSFPDVGVIAPQGELQNVKHINMEIEVASSQKEIRKVLFFFFKPVSPKVVYNYFTHFHTNDFLNKILGLFIIITIVNILSIHNVFLTKCCASLREEREFSL